MIYALDSNIVSYMLKDNDTVYSRYVAALKRGCPCVVPLIVYYEVLRGLKANNATKQIQLFEELCNDMDIKDLAIPDALKATDIYAYRKPRGLPVGDADVLIAAQCVVNGYTLVTNNTKHFENIDGLQIENWGEEPSGTG